MKKKANVLITGANGFLGSALVRQLTQQFNVKTLIRKTSDLTNLKGQAVEVVEGDLRDKDSLIRACKDIEVVFHAAADYRLWVRDPRDLYESNVTGTKNMVEAAYRSNVKKLVYTSSVATLGTNQNGSPANEETPVAIEQMIGHYKKSKFLAEEAVLSFFKKTQFPIIIVNPSTPIGPRDIKPTPTGRMIKDAANQLIPAYVNTGLNLVHVDDVAIGHLLALKHGVPGRKYILGGEDYSLFEILKTVAQIQGAKEPMIQLNRHILYPFAWLWELFASLFNLKEPLLTVDGLKMASKKMYFSSERAKKELSYTYRDPKQGIIDAINWFSAN